MAFLSKYGVARHIYIPVIKRAVVDFAVGADWTPAAGDVKISKDGGAAANVTNLPTAIAMGNGALWDFSLTATEMQAAQVVVTVADSATKAVEDQAFVIETHGHASGQFQVDLADSVRAGLTALPNAAAEAAGGLYTRGSGAGQITQDANGRINANVTALLGTAWLTPGTAGTPDVNVKLWNALTTVELPLVPTTAGRKLDVSAGGEAGVDWANVGSPTTAVDLSGTTIKTTQVVGSVTGAVGSVTGLTAANLDVAVSTRLATSGYTAPLDAAATRSAVGLASANIDTQLAAIAGYIDTEVGTLQTTATAIKNKTDNLPASPAAVGSAMTLTAAYDAAKTAAQAGDAMALTGAAVDLVWDEVLDGAITGRTGMRLLIAAEGGKISGADTNEVTIRNPADTKNRVVATVDATGRTAVVLDLT